MLWTLPLTIHCTRRWWVCSPCCGIAHDIADASLTAAIAEETARIAAVAGVQADVDANEVYANVAIAAVQADVDANEAAADAAIAAGDARVDAMSKFVRIPRPICRSCRCIRSC